MCKSRCAVSIATLPVVAKHHPDACVVWFDTHADLNTPESTTSGYLLLPPNDRTDQRDCRDAMNSRGERYPSAL
ncbi:arginase family protein [Aureimonas ureilytica]|uniref:arginase family protein n=1 Tax=Aureimonas ureilytica TaxID=401562 RepID=UPI0023B92327|nr:arginase family protein [Aureimonas ureilytica]